MNKLVLLLLFAATMGACKTGNTLTKERYKNNIKKDFIEYNRLIKNQEFEKSMDFMLPEFFEIIPKSQMVTLMEKTFNNPDIEFDMDEPRNIVIDNSKKIDGKYYSAIDYSYNIKMKFNNLEISEDEEEAELTRNLMQLSLEKTFGSENVKFNKETEFYDINAKKKAYGISTNGVNDWKFVVIDEKQNFILKKILPKEIMEKL